MRHLRESVGSRRAAMTCVSFVLVLLGLGCARSTVGQDRGATQDAGHPMPRVKTRTVSIQFLKTAEREIDQAADGSFQYGPLTDIGGVEMCVIKRRPAFASFQPFEDVSPKTCTTSEVGHILELKGVPASSDLVITFEKEGYESTIYTSRTDEFDVAPPPWNPRITAMLRRGAADPWLEPDPPAAAGDGRVIVMADAIWWGRGTAPPGPSYDLGADPLPNNGPAEGVRVEISRADGSLVTELSTLRERPRWLSLPEGSYRMRFSHPRMSPWPVGAEFNQLVTGLPVDAPDTIEVPVLAGHVAWSSMLEYCDAPLPAQGIADLPTCTLAPLDAGGH